MAHKAVCDLAHVYPSRLNPYRTCLTFWTNIRELMEVSVLNTHVSAFIVFIYCPFTYNPPPPAPPTPQQTEHIL